MNYIELKIKKQLDKKDQLKFDFFIYLYYKIVVSVSVSLK